MFRLVIRKLEFLTANIIKKLSAGLVATAEVFYRDFLLPRQWSIDPADGFLVRYHKKKALRISLKAFIKVVLSGIEPPTQGFSVLCSTN